MIMAVIVSASAGCGCEHTSGGCIISYPAESGNACTCYFSGLFRCSGSESECPDSDSESFFCIYPDTSIDSCLLGGGNCGGYYP